MSEQVSWAENLIAARQKVDKLHQVLEEGRRIEAATLIKEAIYHLRDITEFLFSLPPHPLEDNHQQADKPS